MDASPAAAGKITLAPPAGWGLARPPGRPAGHEGAREGHAMQAASLTLRSVTARPVVLPLRRPVVARIATIADWPLILIDLHTEEGVVGRSYLEPYTAKAMRYLVPALRDLGEAPKGQRVAPADLYALARRSLHFVGYGGLSMI